MIIGSTPCCDAPLFRPLAPNPPCFERHVCEECGVVLWTLHTRLFPETWTEADFLKEYDVDETTKAVRRKPDAR